MMTMMMRNRGNPETTTTSTTTKKKRVSWSSNVVDNEVSKLTTKVQDPITSCIHGTFMTCSCIVECIEECVANYIELIVDDLILCTDKDNYYTGIGDDYDDDDFIIRSDTSATESQQKVVIVRSATRMSTTTTTAVKNGVECYTSRPIVNNMISTMSSSSNPHNTVLIHLNEQFQPCYDAPASSNKEAAAAASNPSGGPSLNPSANPSEMPSGNPSANPSEMPSGNPSANPSAAAAAVVVDNKKSLGCTKKNSGSSSRRRRRKIFSQWKAKKE